MSSGNNILDVINLFHMYRVHYCVFGHSVISGTQCHIHE